jgi:hypothetical protein
LDGWAFRRLTISSIRSLPLVLVPSAEGWTAYTPDGRYKYAGDPAGSVWFTVGLCRFELGELDEFLPNIRRLEPDEQFLPVP